MRDFLRIRISFAWPLYTGVSLHLVPAGLRIYVLPEEVAGGFLCGMPPLPVRLYYFVENPRCSRR